LCCQDQLNLVVLGSSSSSLARWRWGAATRRRRCWRRPRVRTCSSLARSGGIQTAIASRRTGAAFSPSAAPPIWYGENHKLGGGNKTGISAYSSTDLLHWKNEGVILPKDSLPARYRDGGVAERPKVIFNRSTGRYVMWMHLDANRYADASAGVAVSRFPEGPFSVVRIFRPVHYDYGYGTGEAQTREREDSLGTTFRDMALFQDDDGSAYVIYASESNKTLYAARLSDDYTDVVRPAVEGRTWARLFPGARREAPAPFKVGNSYYMISSAQSGWAPNPARYHIAEHVLGPWRTMGNPVVGPDSATTFRSQSAFVLPVPTMCARCFVYMGDRWESRALDKSTYVWLPFVVRDDGGIRMEFQPRWNFKAFEALHQDGR
jgi:hypothetical protein